MDSAPSSGFASIDTANMSEHHPASERGDNLDETALILQQQQKIIQLQNRLDDKDEDPSYGKRRAQDLIRV